MLPIISKVPVFDQSRLIYTFASEDLPFRVSEGCGPFLSSLAAVTPEIYQQNGLADHLRFLLDPQITLALSQARWQQTG